MKQRHFIDSHKGATGLAVLVMMAIYDRWQNPTAWIYLALHGTYGVLWVLKSRIFPDRAWEEKTGLGFGLFIWATLSLYWIGPWLLISRDIQAPPWYLGLCVSLYVFGVFFHFTADMQKHTALSIKGRHLITDGMMARSRNLNYLGELLVYSGFLLLPMHWLPMSILALIVLGGWVPRMLRKDRSLAKYPEFEQYRKRSKLLVPFLF
jgi:steroid 5-alpha reductase family enzyme